MVDDIVHIRFTNPATKDLFLVQTTSFLPDTTKRVILHDSSDESGAGLANQTKGSTGSWSLADGSVSTSWELTPAVSNSGPAAEGTKNAGPVGSEARDGATSWEIL